ncbi:ATP-dependent RNA helicase suv3 [Coprinopsis cinerea okayama7|uniref:ATP-dependent RNA helicase suv3 n=1 Tax=Coprinopsis cinerea (strain Okayama-7 / 130 / ATCC MYA-4618 / FGSC 9003) TaxID=240176 RepID=A8PAM9_COPC7|nr:ATP-dependent RNA helicase suv3 [Coprinopsis cinerea okayama7\|eukprot:XP_001840016.1 ATP-dependent RNA helicase suv3 [Coprinopsis cinerea okayama7\
MRCRITSLRTKPLDSWLILGQRGYRDSAGFDWSRKPHKPTHDKRRERPGNADHEPTDWILNSLRRPDKGKGHKPRHFEAKTHKKADSRTHHFPKGTFDWNKPRHPPPPKPRGTFNWDNPPRGAFIRPKPYVPPPEIKPEAVPRYFETHVRQWSENADLRGHLVDFGIPDGDLQPLLDAFVADVESGSLTTPNNFAKYELERFSQPLQMRQSLSILYSTIFYTWATEPCRRDMLVNKYKVNPSTLDQMTKLVEATDRRYVAEQFVETRRMQRKVIMHVGPTNSGKTHHALRALAAAPYGVYAGPLRLLAHEIWERLNLGHIVPKGVEDGTYKNDDAPYLKALPHFSTLSELGNPEYARLTNMITGEEQKIVSDEAKILSCTVEMLSFHRTYDVAVVDEIQMITDPQRGSGWTNAVLGLAAKEVHLCGEETAVPIVEALLKDTGDELIVKRYERLTPLKVEEESLGGDYSKVQKGDCIVVFNRKGIFAVKKKVEALTGLRCAVVYGRLPPEIRSEQASLFNDPDSGYDVLIGSDAIGMGLNLKIRRVIFDSVKKFSAGGESLLSISQVKQIAGRAGRFGLHEEPGGYATTLHEEDLPYLREAVGSPFIPLPFARITFDANTFSNLLSVLPPNSSTSTVILAHHYAGRLPPKVRYQDTDFELTSTFNFIDEFSDTLTARERVLHLNAPVTWRDPLTVAMVRTFLEQARDKMYVDLPAALKTTRFMDIMEGIEKEMKNESIPRSNLRDLSTLESFHKSLVLYIWMSFRAPILYPQFQLATELKARLERVLEWSLEGMSDASYIRKMNKQAEKGEEKVEKKTSKPHIPHYNTRLKAREGMAVETAAAAAAS